MAMSIPKTTAMVTVVITAILILGLAFASSWSIAK
jgi:hypothetical protein